MAILTRKFPTVFGLLVLVAGIAFGIWYVNSKKINVAEEVTPNNVRIVNVADNKFTVTWVTPIATAGKVEFGKVGEKLDKTAVDERDSLGNTSGGYLTHFVTVKDLQPSTTYAFRIKSGSGNATYDNNGSPYNVATGPTIAATPPAETIYGQVQQSSTLPAEGAIVYLAIPGAAPAATLVKSSWSYTIPVSILRSTDLLSYVKYDSQATILNITVEQGKQQATASVSTANSAPVPLITMGKEHDFRAVASPPTTSEPVIAQIEPAVVPYASPVASPLPATSPTASPTGTVPGVFNVQPLGDTTSLTKVTIDYPATDKETITSARPELSGKGPKGTVISLVVASSKKTYKDTIAVSAGGSWSWAPTTDLANGSYNMTLAYVDAASKEQTTKRSFSINATLTSLPAFEATPSGSVKASALPSAKASTLPSPSIRAAIPSTDGGVPVTGVIENTILTALLAAVMMVGGVLLIAL